jgi:hypothetical protein
VTGNTGATLIPQDTWVTSTSYYVGDVVVQTGHIYRCLVAHTSGTFSTDLTAVDWVKIGEKHIYIDRVTFDPVAASTDKAVFTCDSGDISAFHMTTALEHIPFATSTKGGVGFTNLKVTLTGSTDVVNIFVDQDKYKIS